MGVQTTSIRNSKMTIRATTLQKEARLSIRASDPEKKILSQAARARHMNTSQFVLQASLDAAQAVLMDQSEFRLPADQWQAFCDQLDAPPKTIPALRKLFSEAEPYSA
jgi:uncharacterized protein (DUF1778 family)